MNTLKISTMARKNRVPSIATMLVLALVNTCAGERPAGTGPKDPGSEPQWSLPAVRHLIGLPGVKQRSVGKLWMSPKGLGFETDGAGVFVESAKILKISVGDERLLKGGALGRFARTGIPAAGGTAIGLSGINQAFSVIPAAFGFGVALASQGRADLLTIEFLDPNDGYHGAVFAMPSRPTDGFDKYLPTSSAALSPNRSPGFCDTVPPKPTSIELLPAVSEGSELPAEYRVLVYERLVRRIQETQSQLRVIRSGDPNDRLGCAMWTLQLTAQSFRKGDAAERALIGPVGLFVGVTSLNYRVEVKDSRGKSMLDEQSSAAVRGDSESLDLTQAIAKSVGSKLGKLLSKTPGA